MLNGIYTALFIMSFIMFVMLVARYKNKISIYYVLMFECVLITNFGYMQLSDATNVKMAIFANQTVYLGSSFCPFFLLMSIADLCKAKVNKALQIFLIVYSAVIFALISSVGAFSWYYKDVQLARENGVSILIKEYGPLHSLYPIYLFGIIIMSFVIVVNSFLRKKDVSYITSSILLVLMVMIVSVYTIEKAFALKTEFLPLAYVIAQIVILILLRRISLYDVTAISTNSMVESVSYGFITYDSNERYLGSDVAAKLWFPEIKELHIDSKVKSEDTDILKQIGKWIRKEDNREIVYFEKDNLIIEAKHTILKEKRRKAIHCFYLRDDTEQQKYTKLVEQYNENLARDINKKTEKIYKIQDDILISMASIVENRDNNTGGHIARTSDVVKIFVNHLLKKNIINELTPKIAKCIIKAAPLHDFGKIAIPDIILNKPGKFTDEEYEEMKKHSEKGAVIVERILKNSEDTTFKKIAVNVAHYHHEKWDGKGYPEGIQGEEIPFEARVMALADVFDALVSKRVYKERLGYDKAFSIIEESCGTHFDPVLCREFLACRPEIEKLYDSYED